MDSFSLSNFPISILLKAGPIADMWMFGSREAGSERDISRHDREYELTTLPQVAETNTPRPLNVAGQ
jgi:hypothetical protein